MTLPDAVASSIRELSRQFEGLQQQVSTLQTENTSLRNRLELLADSDKLVADSGKQPGSLEHWHLPGVTQHEEAGRIQTGMSVEAARPASASRVKRVNTKMVGDRLFEKGGVSGYKGNLAKIGQQEQENKAKDEEENEVENTVPRDFSVTYNLSDAKLSMLLLEPQQDEPSKRRIESVGDLVRALVGQRNEGTLIERFASSLFFHGLAMFAILANSAYLGVAANWDVQDSYRRVQGESELGTPYYVDYIFVTWFTVEIFIRLAAHKREFMVGEDWAWNLFDCVLILESLSSLFVPMMGKLSFLRMLRVFRLVRIVRLVRQVTALKKLRTMVFAFINTFFDLLWAILVIFVIIFIFGVLFANAVASYFQGLDVSSALEVEKAAEVYEEFGGLWKTMLSLWAAVSGGNDWMMYAQLLGNMGEVPHFFFIFYIAFCATGMWNVVTGVFVDSAVCSRTEDEVVQGYMEEYRNTQNQIRHFFAEADRNGSGTVKFDDFTTCLMNPVVKAYLSGMDIDPDEGSIIFAILDSNRNGEIVIDEFVNGLLKLKGGATKLDFMAMMYDSTMQNLKFDSLVEFVEQSVDDLKTLIATK